jgi:hypothetical protein
MEVLETAHTIGRKHRPPSGSHDWCKSSRVLRKLFVPKKSRSFIVILIAFILSLQSVGLLAIAALFSYETATAPSLSLGGAIFFDVLVWISALAAGAATWAFWNGRSGVRGAIIVWQMILVGIAIATAQGSNARIDLALIFGVPAAVVAIFVLFNRGVSRHLGVGA